MVREGCHSVRLEPQRAAIRRDPSRIVAVTTIFFADLRPETRKLLQICVQPPALNL